MNNKKLFILTISLGVIALAFTLISSWSSKNKANWNLPEDRQLISMEALRATQAIEIRKDGDVAVRLNKDDAGNWVVGPYYGLTLDRSVLDRLIEGLRKAEITRFVTRTREKADALSIGQMELRFLGDNEQLEALIKIGKDGKNGGKFVRRNDEEEVYYTDFAATIDISPKSWAKKQLFNLDVEDIAKLSLTWVKSGETLTISRPDKETDYTLQDAAEGESLNTDVMNRNLRTLLSARFTEAMQPSEAAYLETSLQSGLQYEIDTFDGKRVSIQIGRTTTVVEEEKENEEEEAEVKEKEEHGPVYAKFDASALVEEFPQVARDLVFEMSDYTFTSQPENRSAWIKTDPANDN